MSIYRTIDDGPITEFSVQRVKVKRARDERSTAADPIPVAQLARLRRAQPACEPLPATFRWIVRLPRHVRPIGLLRDFPRVANSLASSWHDPRAFRACLYELLVDRRGGRKGFTDEVLSELLALRAYFDDACL